MLEKEEKRKFPVTCPHCQKEQDIGDFGWLGIFDNLDRFGKTVMRCTECRDLYVISEKNDGTPFVRHVRY